MPRAYVDAFCGLTNASALGDEGLCVAQTGPDAAPGATGVYPGFVGAYSCRGLYAASVAFLDANLAALTTELRRSGAWDTTLFVFQSDNGGCEQLVQSAATNFPLRGGKGSDFEGGHRVAAFVSGGFLPETRRGAVLRDVATHVADWYATFCAFAGVRPADEVAAAAGLPPVDGEDIWPTILGAGTPSRAYLPLSDDALLETSTGLKLVLGVQKFAGSIGPVFPNATSPRRDPELETRDCGTGCLYDLSRGRARNSSAGDPEAVDFAEERPEDLRRLQGKLAALALGFWEGADHDCGVDFVECAGVDVPCACHVAVVTYGGYFGPYRDAA